VSIVTAVRNGRAFIADTLKSVATQTYPNCEHIVVDGASTDGTPDIVRPYEARLSHWISEPDRGIADAFNKGLRLATGDYIMFLNADDWLADADALARLVAAARERGWPQVIYGDCDVFDRYGSYFLYRASIPYDRAALLRGATLPHPGLLTHRDYFARHGAFDESFRIAMDFEMFLRGVPEGGAVHVPVLVTNIRSGGLSTRDRALAVEEIIRALKKNSRITTRFGELVLRLRYSGRYVARRLLEAVGLYRMLGKAMLR
jgi:glycosyltransferase involved in cell wall biosynthesis